MLNEECNCGICQNMRAIKEKNKIYVLYIDYDSESYGVLGVFNTKKEALENMNDDFYESIYEYDLNKRYESWDEGKIISEKNEVRKMQE